jgi:integrase
LKNAKADFDYLSFDESDRVVRAAECEFKAMIVVALKTGMRLGELLGCRWQDVDLVKRQVRVVRAATRGVISTPKSGRSRVIPLPMELVEVLRGHGQTTRLRGELVFSGADGALLTRDNVKRALPRACRKAGLREVGWHTLRHTYASHLVMLGVPLKAVQELLGHATLEMTMRYAHRGPDVKRGAVDLLDTREVYNAGLLALGKGS